MFGKPMFGFKLKIRVARLTMNHSGGLREISSRVQSPSSPGRWEYSEMCPYDRVEVTQRLSGLLVLK
jgi:hypothetical protein